jgi:Flp pilus assembly protein TadD
MRSLKSMVVVEKTAIAGNGDASMMAVHKSRFGALIICVGLLYGCAGSPTKNADGGLADSVSKENLDLLFATEFPVASKQEAITKSNLAYRDGDVDKALFYSVMALKFDVTDVEILLRIAHLHVLQGNSRMAARTFNLALAQDPSHPESLQGLGLLYFEADQPARARHNLELAVAGDQSLWRSYNVLGVLADGRREHDVAADYYSKALEIRPDSVSVLINRGYSTYLAGDLETAARYLYEVASQSDHPKAWRNLGMVYAELGWYDEALEIFRKVEDEANANNSTGEIALANKDLTLAHEFFSEAVRQSPVYFAKAERNLVRVRSARGK